MVGKYRIGKSFLLNKMIGRPSIFGVGHTTNACTQGIWIYN